MAPSSASQPRSLSSRPGSSGRPRGRPSHNPSHHRLTNGSAPPLKKRRYVPGGPGGGGRYVDVDGNETPVGGTGPGGYAYTGPPRPRAARENAVNGGTPSTYPRRRERAMPQQRYSSAAAAAAAVQGDGYKPREERGWEEFHPHLDIEASIAVFSNDEVDGITQSNADAHSHKIGQEDGSFTGALNGTRTPNEGDSATSPNPATENGLVNGDSSTPKEEGSPQGESREILFIQPPKKRVGRPPVRRSEPARNGSITPNTPKVIPMPGPNPREKLTLPKPSFRASDPFATFEQKDTGQQRYVDRPMASVGYQESDIFDRPDSQLIRMAEGTIEEDLDLGPGFKSDSEANTALGGNGVGRVEYDMDEQDDKWLASYNAYRKLSGIEPITREVFEITMTKIEKEWHALEKRIPKPNPKPPQTHRPRSSSAAAVNGEANAAAGEEQDSKCAICDDGDCENTNAIVFCDGCDLAVHQECYGVPFIPEGQWLCRKCQLIGRGTPTCIFCPNTDGAFKQTNASRWSHLLCAIWIPEVSLGNPTFMEPVMDVEKVPKQRWKLTCYICRQRMGACIQCGNKNCFIAFHVTCARRARLFLKMKSAHGGPANLDASVLKAYCDKHVPAEWRRENDVDAATSDAQDYYHHTMRGRLWADSQQSALAAIPPQTHSASQHADRARQPSLPRISFTVGANKRKRTQPPKSVWKLPTGAPVVPQVVYNTLETSLQRFTVLKRKEYAAEACKYWTLKREARRGAALLKRLQLQMDTFSSMEITRRNFSGMGAAGRVRLKRRIDFATELLQDVEKLRVLCDEVKKRELEKLREAEMMKELVDTVYLPIAPLLWPVLKKAQSLDSKEAIFRDGLVEIQSNLEEGYYTSVPTFTADLAAVFSSGIGLEVKEAEADASTRLNQAFNAEVLTSEQKDKRRLARRIIKAIQSSLEEASRKEAELGLRPFERELKDLDLLLDSSVLSRRGSINASAPDDPSDSEMKDLSTNVKASESLSNGITDPMDVEADDEGRSEHMADQEENAERHGAPNGNGVSAAEAVSDATRAAGESVKDTSPLTLAPDTTHRDHHEVTTHMPPASAPQNGAGNLLGPLTEGGVPWYLQPFDPVGLTIQEERWTGPEVVRSMSEELSEIDDDVLKGLVDEDMPDATESVEKAVQDAIPPPVETSVDENEVDAEEQAKAAAAAAAKKKKAARRRSRAYR